MEWSPIFAGAIIGAFLGFFVSVCTNYLAPIISFRIDRCKSNAIKKICNEPIFRQKNNFYSSICTHIINDYQFSQLIKEYIDYDGNDLTEAVITNVQAPSWYHKKLKENSIFALELNKLEDYCKQPQNNLSNIKRCLDSIKNEFYVNDSHGKYPHQKSIYKKELSTIRYNFYQLNFNYEGGIQEDKALKEFKRQNSLATVLVFEKIFGNHSFNNGSKILNLVLPPNHHELTKEGTIIKGTDSILLLKKKSTKKKSTKKPLALKKTAFYYDDEIYMLSYQKIGKSDCYKDSFFKRVLDFKDNSNSEDTDQKNIYMLHDFRKVLIAYKLSQDNIDYLMR